jgi:FAD:protein FMN transferase
MGKEKSEGDFMRKAVLTISILTLLLAVGCSDPDQDSYNRYNESIFDTFDTLVQVIVYAESEEEFRQYADIIHSRLRELHRLYDIYNSYEGINNIKTINDNAGIQPVLVDQEIIDLILFSIEWSERTGGSFNIALGPVLEIWHNYREEALFDPQSAELPPMDLLREAAEYTDISQVLVDREQMTVYLPESRMSLDVGAVAKGFALEIAVREAEEAGLRSAIISAGGNIRTIGRPLDGIRDRWGIGVQDPDASIVGGGENLLDVIYLSNGSVDTSGDYQRYYVVDGELVHHLIDPETLMPAVHFRAVTVVGVDSGLADIMSTVLFLIPYPESLALVESLENFEALWVMPDGEVRITDGMQEMLQSYGAGSVDEE